MGQSEVIELLEKMMKPMSRTQIACELQIDPHHISTILKNLIEWNEVQFKELDRFEAEKFCGTKRRMKIYFVE